MTTHNTNAQRHDRMPFDEYRALPGINATALKAGMLSMLHMHDALTGGGKEATAAMEFGRNAHTHTLEPNAFNSRVSVYEGTRRGKAWYAFEAEHADQIIITSAEHERLIGMRAHLFTPGTMRAALLGEAHTEVSITWEDEHYGKAKARIDATHAGAVIEYKTTAAIHPAAFLANSYKLGYHTQLAWYWHAARLVGINGCVWVICQQTKRPYDVALYRVNEAFLEARYLEAAKLAATYRTHEVVGEFPGVAPEPLEYEFPAWATGVDAVPDGEISVEDL